MTCALKEYNSLKGGKARRLPDQYNFLSKFYHGKAPTRPSQIKLLAEASLNYRAIYTATMKVVKIKHATKDKLP